MNRGSMQPIETPEGLRVPLLRADRTIAAYALLSAEDAQLASLRWHLGMGYARRNSKVKGKTVLLHRAVLGLAAADPREVDHINRDRLDNRRENLRIVSRSEQMQNLSERRGCTSRHRGVSLDKRWGRWRAYASLSGRRHDLGRFPTEDEAARVARDWRRDHMPFATE